MVDLQNNWNCLLNIFTVINVKENLRSIINIFQYLMICPARIFVRIVPHFIESVYRKN